VVSQPVNYDADDPAIWVNPKKPTPSLIPGTDKDADGGLHIFDLNGKVLANETIKGLKRPNNVEVRYGLRLQGRAVDFAVTTEILTHKLRIFSLPYVKGNVKGSLVRKFENLLETKKLKL
jgi:3-phytase